jgi:branched-chain amino acid transport system permease protein
VTDFLQALFSGVAVGSQYALVVLGFVVIFRGTGVINFAHGGFVLIGAYLTFHLSVRWAVPFALAVVMAMALGALFGVLVQRLVIKRMVGQPVFAIVMVTIGLLYVIEPVIPSIWGYWNLNLGDPWGIDTVRVGGLVLSHRNLWTIGLTALVVVAFFLFFRRTNLGLAMQATAADQEAALARGVNVPLVLAASWGIAGAVAALAGVTLAAGPGALHPGIGHFALFAFPAMILGGMDSPVGAIVGGLIIGIVQQLTAHLQPVHAEWLGTNFHLVMPYIVMIAIMLVRPWGLFGSPEVRRV